MNNLSIFIKNIEEIYENINIYRMIIIINNNIKEIELIKELKDKNHIPIIINNINDIDYNYRLFIIKDIRLLSFVNKKYYNFIAIY